MTTTMRRLLLLLALLTVGAVYTAAQDRQSDLLSRINNLRQSQGLPAYSINGSLNSAANNHARWLARTGQISHLQEDGTGPRTRAQNAGYSSNWVSENIYRGFRASALDAWNWWLGSPIHYAGITSPNYDNVGIGSASGEFGTAYVLVFGNSLGRLPTSGANAAQQPSGVKAPVAPSYVLGIDDVGNIKHEVQAGDTMGDIALIYGYTWADIPYMLEINGMSPDDQRLLQPGSIFLVPPKDGTFTPVPITPSATQRSPATGTPSPTTTRTATPNRQATQTPLASPVLRIGIPQVGQGSPPPKVAASRSNLDLRVPLILAAAIVAQMGIVAGALLALLRRSP